MTKRAKPNYHLNHFCGLELGPLLYATAAGDASMSAPFDAVAPGAR